MGVTIDTAKLTAYLIDRFADVVTCGVMDDCLEEFMGRQHVHAAVTAGLAVALATGGVPTAAIADTLGIKADSACDDCLEEFMGRQHVHAAVTAGLAVALATGGVPTAAIADTLGIKADSACEPGPATWKEGQLKSPGKTDALGTESLHMGSLGQQTVQGGVPDASADKSTPDATWKEGQLKSPGKTDALGTESLHMGSLGQQTVQGGVPDASADKSTPDPMVDEVEADLTSTLAPSASIDKVMKPEGSEAVPSLDSIDAHPEGGAERSYENDFHVVTNTWAERWVDPGQTLDVPLPKVLLIQYKTLIQRAAPSGLTRTTFMLSPIPGRSVGLILVKPLMCLCLKSF